MLSPGLQLGNWNGVRNFHHPCYPHLLILQKRQVLIQKKFLCYIYRQIISMRKMLLIVSILLCFATIHAQKTEYKNGMIQVDGKDYAKMEVKKQNFGLTKSFEVFSLSGKKIIIAAVASEFESDKSDNTYLFYRLTFLTSNQIGIFKISSLSQEKSFVKLIGTSGILENDTTNDIKVKEFIASKGASPTIAVNYTTVARSRTWPVRIQLDKNIEQNSTIIGSYKPAGPMNGSDHYDFFLPSGVLIAKVSFTGGDNAQNFELFTAKDNLKRVVLIPQKDKILASAEGNMLTLQRIAKWLVDNQYL